MYNNLFISMVYVGNCDKMGLLFFNGLECICKLKYLMHFKNFIINKNIQ